MSQLARFHVVVRFGDRIVEDRCVEDSLTVGDGGEIVVPGVGDVAVVLQHGALRSVAGLDGAVDGVVLQEGERCELRSIAHPSLAIAIERIASERVTMRSRVAFAPARETIFAGALACCMATMFGGKVVIGSLTEAEIEREQTPLEIAMFETTPVIPAVTFTPPIVYVAPEPVLVEEPVLADARALAEPAVHDEIGEAIAPEALPVPKPAPKKKRARPRPRVDELVELSAIGDLVETDMVAVLSARSDGELADLLTSSTVEGIPGGVVRGVAIERPQDEGVGGLAIVGTGAGVPIPEKVEATAKAEPVPEDPRGGKFTLADAFAGADELARGKGKLVAHLHIGDEMVHCELFEDRAPIAVANFVGLIRGTRETLDPATNRWTKKPFYEGLTFHRVVDGFVIQGGDPEGTGKGGPGYKIPDEIDPSFHFDRAGILAMANSGPNTGGSQFYITLAAAPHLDGKQTAFGQCNPEGPQKLGKVPTGDRDVPTERMMIGKAWVRRELVETNAPSEPEVVTPSITIDVEPPSAAPVDPTLLDAPQDR